MTTTPTTHWTIPFPPVDFSQCVNYNCEYQIKPNQHIYHSHLLLLLLLLMLMLALFLFTSGVRVNTICGTFYRQRLSYCNYQFFAEFHSFHSINMSKERWIKMRNVSTPHTHTMVQHRTWLYVIEVNYGDLATLVMTVNCIIMCEKAKLNVQRNPWIHREEIRIFMWSWISKYPFGFCMMVFTQRGLNIAT